MVYFGDVDVPWVVDKDTSIEKEVVEKNFVDSPPQVFELTPNLEAGTYSLILNEDVHDRGESFEEQRDAVSSMPSRHACEFPVNVGGDVGHILVNSSSVSITPSNAIQEASIDVRFLDDDEYRPAISTQASHLHADFSPTPLESFIALPSSVQNVSSSPLFTVSTEGGDVDCYSYGSVRSTLEYDLSESQYTTSERVSPVRVYDVQDGYSGGSYSDGDRRVYSDSVSLDNTVVDNGLVKSHSDGDKCEIYKYDVASSAWDLLGSVVETNGNGFLKTPSNYKSSVSFIDSYELSVYRGYSVVEYSNVSGVSEFRFSAENSLGSGSDNGYYYTVSDSTGDLIVVREKDVGTFNQGNGDIYVSGLDTSEEYTFYVGYVPSGVTVSDYARYIYNRGSWRRTFTQRQ